MHNNYYFLRQLTEQIRDNIVGARLVECFSQNRDELILVFEKKQQYINIKAHLLSTFSCLSFPREFHRARKNSIDLFGEIIESSVTEVRQFENERSFALYFENNHVLLFKMHGNKSNVILFTDGEKVLFKNSYQGDENTELDLLDRSVAFDKTSFEENLHQIKKFYFTFGPVVWRYLKEKNFEQLPSDAQWQLISATIAKLENPVFYIVKMDKGLALSLLPVGEIISESTNAIEILNEFFFTYTQTQAIQQERQQATALLQQKLKASRSFLSKTKTKLAELKEINIYKVWADMLMANLHQIQDHVKTVALPDFNDPSRMVEIPLSESMTPQKNAERYYRKSKNHQLEINRLEETILAKEKEIKNLTVQSEEVERAQNLKSLRSLIDQYSLQKKKQTETIILPYRAVEFQGFQIWIGKNAKSNDELTLKFSYKDDLWLHAKDVSGSHVLIKYKSGQPYPKEVIERGAQLASFFSKRKTDSLCPVAYTQKKFVRKRKGDPAGMVVMEKETVILVEPKGL